MRFDNGPTLGKVLGTVGSYEKLRTLSGIANDESLTDVADELGMSRSGLQNYLNDFKQAQVVVKGRSGYELTDRGEWFLERLEEMDEGISDFVVGGAADVLIQELGGQDAEIDTEQLEQVMNKARQRIEEADTEQRPEEVDS